MTALFFAMAIGPIDNLYLSDTPPHIEFGMDLSNPSAYGLESILIYLLSRISSRPFLQLLFAVYETFVIMLTWLLSQRFIDELFGINKFANLTISTGLIFLSGLYIPYIYPYYYVGGVGTQPWHNSTYYGMRLFALAYLFVFFRVWPGYMDGINKKEWIKMAVFLMLSTAFKPNFLFDAGITLGILLLIDLIRYHTKEAFRKIVIMGTTFIPAMCVLMIQYIRLYAAGNNGGKDGIMFQLPEELLHGNSSTLLKYGRPFLFPIVVIIMLIILGRNNDHNTEPENRYAKNLIFSILLFVSSIMISMTLVETGQRELADNFSWGVCAAFYCMYLFAAPLFVKLIEVNKGNRKKVFLSVTVVAGTLLFMAHVLSGISYFILMMKGNLCLL